MVMGDRFPEHYRALNYCDHHTTTLESVGSCLRRPNLRQGERTGYGWMIAENTDFGESLPAITISE